MKRYLVITALALVALTGCSATSATTANTPQATESATPTPTPTPSPSSIAQGVKDLKAATAKMTPAQQDTVYLGGARSSVKTGTDASLIAIGHKMCADLAAGVDMAGRIRDIAAAGYPSADSLAIIISAGLAYCKA